MIDEPSREPACPKQDQHAQHEEAQSAGSHENHEHKDDQDEQARAQVPLNHQQQLGKRKDDSQRDQIREAAALEVVPGGYWRTE